MGFNSGFKGLIFTIYIVSHVDYKKYFKFERFKSSVKVPKLIHSSHTGCYCRNPPLKDSGTVALYGGSEIYILKNTKGADIELRPSLPALTYLWVCYCRTLENFKDYVKSAVDKEIIMECWWTYTGRNKKTKASKKMSPSVILFTKYSTKPKSGI